MERLLTVEEVAEYLRLNRETVLRKARKGEIPAIRMGYRSYRFYQEQIDDWLKAKAETKKVAPRSQKVKKSNLKTYPLGIIGGLSRRDIYEGR